MKKSDPVERLNFNDRKMGVELVADPGSDGEFDNLFGFRLQEIDLLLKVFCSIKILFLTDVVECFYDGLLFVSVIDCLEILVADSEEIEDDAVGAGIDIGGENADLMRGEGAANFFEEAFAVVSSDDEFAVAKLFSLDPLNSAFKLGVWPS